MADQQLDEKTKEVVLVMQNVTTFAELLKVSVNELVQILERRVREKNDG